MLDDEPEDDRPEDLDEPVEDNPVLISEGKYIYAQAERDGKVVRERVSRHVLKLPPDKQEIYFRKIAATLRIKLNRVCAIKVSKPKLYLG